MQSLVALIFAFPCLLLIDAASVSSAQPLSALPEKNQTIIHAVKDVVAPEDTSVIPPTLPPPPTPTPVIPTTVAPTTTAAPFVPDRKFDGASFIGGFVLCAGLTAIGFVSWKFYKARVELTYRTL